MHWVAVRLVLIVSLATALELAIRSLAPVPFAPDPSDLVLRLLLYTFVGIPALAVGALRIRWTQAFTVLLGLPAGMLVANLTFALTDWPSRLVASSALGGALAGAVVARIAGKRVLGPITAACLIVAAAARLVGVSAARVTERPTVILVVLDTAAVARLSAFDPTRRTSPNLAALRERSLWYERTIAAAPWTLPSHASLFSGRYPSELGFDGAAFGNATTAGSIAADLEKAGWQAHAISANPVIPASEVLRAGYRSAWEAERLTQPFVFRALDRLRKREGFQSRGDRVTALALDWIDRVAPRGHPWLLFVNYLDPHAPYRPPEPQRERFAPGIDPDVLSEDMQQYNSGALALNQEIRDAMRRLYDGEIAAMDAALGRLFEGLETRGHRTENCFIIVTADHGESLGEHGFVGHLLGMPDTVLHVPLLIAGPGIEPGVIETPVQLVQLRATLRVLLGLPPLPDIAPPLPPWGPGPELLIAEHPEPKWYLRELRDFNADANVHPWRGNWVAVERNGLKVVFDDRGRGRTYDLRTDPNERFPMPLSAGAALVEAYAAWRARSPTANGGAPSESTRRALEAIGYLR